MNKKGILAFLITIILLLRIIPYISTYQKPFEKNYWYHRFDISQWRVPESKNPIDDAGLYKIAGYDLAIQHRFFVINPEVPPLAKYLYGWSILLFHNAEMVSLLMYIISVWLFYYLVSFFTKNIYFHAVATLLFIFDPLIFEHATTTLLDLPQLMVLLIHIISILKLISNHKKESTKNQLLYTLIAGLSFGAFISMKIAFFGIIIIALDAIVLLMSRQWKKTVGITIIAGLIYLMSYSMYFVQGHSIIEFLKAQKWMIHFYLDSPLKHIYGTVFTTLLYGRTIGWHKGAQWEGVAEWTLLWTVYLLGWIVSIATLIKNKFKTDLSYLYLLVLTTLLLGAYAYIPFFTRYLILIIPLFIILLAILAEKTSFRLFHNKNK